jgi:hypothetical protein
MVYLPNHGYRWIQTGRRLSDSAHKKEAKYAVHMLPDTPIELAVSDIDTKHVSVN